MPARRRRLAPIAAAVVALALAVGVPGLTAAGGYAQDTYFSSAYDGQIDNRTCVPASVSMTLNILEGSDIDANQMTILQYAQPRDALDDGVQRGTDPLGWSVAATHFSQTTRRPTTYRWEAYDRKGSALRRAAMQIARFDKPVGLLVQHGQHAVLMTGFTATANPLKQRRWSLTGIWFSDPLGSHHAYVSFTNAPLNTYLETDATPEYDALWYGKYIVVVPRN